MNNNHTTFHNKHEKLSEDIYNNSSMLPSRYVFVLTNKCNLNCSFCYQDKQTLSKNMSTDDWLNVLEQIPAYSRVTLTGGEPLIFKGFKTVFSKAATDFDCNIITNGLLLSKEIIDFMLSFEKFQVLSISVDNIGNTTRDVTSEQWEKLKENLLYFIEKRNELGSKALLDIKTLILDENSTELFDIYTYCKEELKCDTHAFQFLKGSPLQHADSMYPYDSIFVEPKTHIYSNFTLIKEQLKKVQAYNQTHQKNSYVHPNFIDLSQEESLEPLNILNEPFKPKSYKHCIFPWSSVHINYDGEVFPCLSIGMGNLKTTSLKEVIFSDTFMQFKKELKEKLVPSCSRCGWLRPKEI